MPCGVEQVGKKIYSNQITKNSNMQCYIHKISDSFDKVIQFCSYQRTKWPFYLLKK